MIGKKSAQIAKSLQSFFVRFNSASNQIEFDRCNECTFYVYVLLLSLSPSCSLFLIRLVYARLYCNPMFRRAAAANNERILYAL
jgi:hypothetical protein